MLQEHEALTCSSGAGGRKLLGMLGREAPGSPEPKSRAPMLCRKLPTVCCWSSGGVDVPLRSTLRLSAV
jgi:hypothetical protein